MQSDADQKPIVAIDGPSGAGKSTVSRLLAETLGFTYIDTGAMYRCVGLQAVRNAIPCEAGPKLDSLLSNLSIHFEGPATRQKVFCNGEDVSKQIREHAISKAASDFSALESVRQRLVALQRQMGEQGGVVMEGRDIGTNVFPNAQVKVYLDASARIRAKRRYDELILKGEKISFEQVLEDQVLRDRQDMQRTLNPLKKAENAIQVDTDGLSVESVVENLCKIVKKKH